jgi:hypothetical protein
MIVRLVLALIVATALGLATTGTSPASATTTPDETLLTLPPDDQPVTTDNEFLDLERDMFDDCVGSFLPKPDCGREPTHSGDRGGVMQWSVFGVMILGIGFIGWRIIAGARRNRRPSAV